MDSLEVRFTENLAVEEQKIREETRRQAGVPPNKPTPGVEEVGEVTLHVHILPLLIPTQRRGMQEVRGHLQAQALLEVCRPPVDMNLTLGEQIKTLLHRQFRDGFGEYRLDEHRMPTFKILRDDVTLALAVLQAKGELLDQPVWTGLRSLLQQAWVLGQQFAEDHLDIESL